MSAGQRIRTAIRRGRSAVIGTGRPPCALTLRKRNFLILPQYRKPRKPLWGRGRVNRILLRDIRLRKLRAPQADSYPWRPPTTLLHNLLLHGLMPTGSAVTKHKVFPSPGCRRQAWSVSDRSSAENSRAPTQSKRVHMRQESGGGAGNAVVPAAKQGLKGQQLVRIAIIRFFVQLGGVLGSAPTGVTVRPSGVPTRRSRKTRRQTGLGGHREFGVWLSKRQVLKVAHVHQIRKHAS